MTPRQLSVMRYQASFVANVGRWCSHGCPRRSSHGDVRAVFSAVRAARDAVQNNVMEKLREVGREIPAKTTLVGAASGDED